MQGGEKIRRRTIVGLMGMLVLSLCFFPMTAYAGGGTSHDGLGDWISSGGTSTTGSAYADIRKVQFSTNKTTMTVTFTLADVVPSNPSSERLFYSIEIDADQNPATGRQDYPKDPIFNGMGVDYEVAVHYETPTQWPHPGWSYTLWDFTPSPWKDSEGSYSISGNRVKMSFPLSEVGSPTKFNVVFVTWEHQMSPNLIWAFDHTPNTGVITLGK